MVIRECFQVTGGNSGLTESVIYQNPPKNEEQSVKVYSGSTLETTLLGSVDKDTMLNGKRMSVFTAPAIIIVRKGLAGNTKFVEKGIFTINDDAYVITIKEKYLDKINIEWAQKVLQSDVLHQRVRMQPSQRNSFWTWSFLIHRCRNRKISCAFTGTSMH